MLQIAICDDEPFYQEKIKLLLKQYLAKHDLHYSIHCFLSGEAFLAQSQNSVKYDVIFMDINMENLDGIQTAIQIRSFHSDTYLVFVTAFIDYALEGYKVNATRYIMKDTLDIAVFECMDAILQKMQLEQVSFAFIDGERKLYTDNILYVESRKHKSIFFYMSAGKSDAGIVQYQIYDKLDTIEQALLLYGFLRIHKSYLINMKHLHRISNYTAFLDTGKQLPVPRLRYQAVKETFISYKGAL